MQPLPEPPEPLRRPHFAFWLWQRGITLAEAAAVLNIGPEQVRRYCLPFGRADRVVPPEETIARIVAWTRGNVVASDFYPAPLNGQSPALAESLRLARAQ